MNHDRYDNDYIADILKTTKTIALLGASPNPELSARLAGLVAQAEAAHQRFTSR